jgi:hypothetical protein
MAAAQFDATEPSTPFGGAGRLERLTQIAAMLTSVGMVVGFVIWGYHLATRDISGVPVVRALSEPMRIAPALPGGEVAEHQGLAVNEIAAVGVAAPPADRLVLAPRPVELTEEDAPGVAPTLSEEAAAAAALPTVTEKLADPAQLLPVDPGPSTEDAIALALAEALGLAPPQEAPEAAALPEGTLAASPLPRARPDRGLSGPVTAIEPTSAPQAREIDPATIEPGTRLVQLGAYDTADEARAAWSTLLSRFGDLLTDKSLVVQSAESGGRTFYRLRAHGFSDEDAARRLCSALLTEDTPCIPVAQR